MSSYWIQILPALDSNTNLVIRLNIVEPNCSRQSMHLLTVEFNYLLSHEVFWIGPSRVYKCIQAPRGLLVPCRQVCGKDPYLSSGV
jgi:hypothetical protein